MLSKVGNVYTSIMSIYILYIYYTTGAFITSIKLSKLSIKFNIII